MLEKLTRYNLHVEDLDHRIQFIASESGEWIKADSALSAVERLSGVADTLLKRSTRAEVRIAEPEAERTRLTDMIHQLTYPAPDNSSAATC